MGLCVALSACVSNAARASLTEDVYQAAARRCHMDEVIRLRRGERQFLMLPGASSPGTPLPPYERRVRCLERYLGVSPKDVEIVYE